ncbi:MAG: glycogen debranching protein [Bacteroidia bacterium]|nr:MAG: glycogen debranching protein [Bacteroidia bacterium]
MKRIILILSIVALAISCRNKERIIYESAEYRLTNEAVYQGKYSAKALSADFLTSDYQSPANNNISALVEFKFSINGKDNEFLPGINHKFVVSSEPKAKNEINVVFGSRNGEEDTGNVGETLKPNTKLSIKLDFNKVLQAFEKEGFYTCVSGEKIYKNDFKALFVAGNRAPLSWDFENLGNKGLELKDENHDGIYELELLMNPYDPNNFTAKEWKLSNNISKYPQLSSKLVLLDALYNMGLDEMCMNIEKDGTFRTGKAWPGVWTRDISYSVFLSLAILEPEICKTSLMRKVQNGKIIQDTGTGGAWPISSDRIVWGMAAFEIYKVTGDKKWLREIYEIIKKTLEIDLLTIVDAESGLMHGESSFLDWRKQSYPDWMNSTDIYTSLNLGTNAAHFKAYEVLAEIAGLLGEESAKYEEIAQNLKQAINREFWIAEKGYYAQFAYGRNAMSISRKSESLGEAFCVLFDIASGKNQARLVSKTPLVPFGISCVFPQKTQISPYHNNGIWPFVQAFWNMAAAKTKNYAALEHGLAAFYRAAALFLTNKENFVAQNGDFRDTEVNSDRQLWSVAGNMALVYRILFGMEFLPDALKFAPVVPENYGGKIKLSGFTYRKAVLDIEIQGFGDKIAAVELDDKEIENVEIPASLEGKHALKIVLNNEIHTKGKINLTENAFTPTTPYVKMQDRILSWDKIENAAEYIVYRNGKEFAKTRETTFKIPQNTGMTEWQIQALGKLGVVSFLSEPIVCEDKENTFFIEAEKFAAKSALPYQGFSGEGFVAMSTSKNTSLDLLFDCAHEGMYAVDFKYSNGSGAYNTDNKCAIRTMFVNDLKTGVVVMPQIGKDEWSNFGYSNMLKVKLKKGRNKISLRLMDYNENMNVEINTAMLDGARIRKI